MPSFKLRERGGGDVSRPPSCLGSHQALLLPHLATALGAALSLRVVCASGRRARRARGKMAGISLIERPGQARSIHLCCMFKPHWILFTPSHLASLGTAARHRLFSPIPFAGASPALLFFLPRLATGLGTKLGNTACQPEHFLGPSTRFGNPPVLPSARLIIPMAALSFITFHGRHGRRFRH